jgi:hypothetical protein
MFKSYALVLILICCSCTKNDTNTASISLPVLSSVSVDFQEKSIARFAVIASVIKNGGSSITEQGVIWGVSPNLSLSSGNKLISQSGDSSMRENIDGITMNKIYYVRAFATNKIGTSYSNEISTKLPVDVSWMGPGGIVFYMFKEGENGFINGETHGLQAIGGPAVESGKFDCGQINLGTSTIIGAGKSNTDKIINKGCPTMGLYIGNSIIKLNANKYQGYSDWFIPSRDEYLAMIAYNLKEKQRKLQISTSFPIWTSSEADSSRAYSFDNNIELIKSKQGFNYYSVPIRAF